MLPIALQLVSSLVAGNRPIAAFRLLAGSLLHLSLVLFIGAAAYSGTLLAIITVYAPHRHAAAFVYGIGFGGASLLGVWVASLVTPAALSRYVIASAATLSTLLPLVLVFSYAVAGDGRMASCLWYLSGSLAGSWVAVRLLVGHRAEHRIGGGRHRMA